MVVTQGKKNTRILHLPLLLLLSPSQTVTQRRHAVLSFSLSHHQAMFIVIPHGLLLMLQALHLRPQLTQLLSLSGDEFIRVASLLNGKSVVTACGRLLEKAITFRSSIKVRERLNMSFLLKKIIT